KLAVYPEAKPMLLPARTSQPSSTTSWIHPFGTDQLPRHHSSSSHCVVYTAQIDEHLNRPIADRQAPCLDRAASVIRASCNWRSCGPCLVCRQKKLGLDRCIHARSAPGMKAMPAVTEMFTATIARFSMS